MGILHSDTWIAGTLGCEIARGAVWVMVCHSVQKGLALDLVGMYGNVWAGRLVVCWLLLAPS